MATPITRFTQVSSATANLFDGLPPSVQKELEQLTLSNSYPVGATLFSEAQQTRGIFLVTRGRVKLSVCASDGKTLILRICESGEVLGVSASISGKEYEATATIQEPSEISFLRHSDFLRLMRTSAEFALWVTQHLSQDYSSTCREIRNLMLSDSASEKFARFLVERMQEKKECPQAGQMKMAFTHEEIGQMIGTSRETVTRLFAGFRRKRLIQLHGSTLVVPNRLALESMIQ